MTIIREKAFERVTSKGLLEVFAIHHMGSHWVESQLAGQKHACTLGLGTLKPAKVINGTTYTHSHGQCAITSAEAAMIDAAMSRVRSTYEATPEGLRSCRRMLAENIGYARQNDKERREAAWTREDEVGWSREDAHGKIAAAEKALAEFDASHPEVIAAWDAKGESQRATELADQIAYRGE